MPRHREMAGAPVASGERRVGHFADERLDEAVLAALRGTGVGLDFEDLPSDQ